MSAIMETLPLVWPSRPVQVTDADLPQLVAQYPVVVLDVYADWCPPCRALAPILDALASELSGKVVIAKLDADSNRAPAALGVSALPTLVVFRDGQVLGRIVGGRSKDTLRQAFLEAAA